METLPSYATWQVTITYLVPRGHLTLTFSRREEWAIDAMSAGLAEANRIAEGIFGRLDSVRADRIEQ